MDQLTKNCGIVIKTQWLLLGNVDEYECKTLHFKTETIFIFAILLAWF